MKLLVGVDHSAESRHAIETRIGHAGTALCDAASEADIDAIVIGSHDKNAWERLLQPSIGRYLIDNAPCPVIVVR